jgi:hypothetical protein
MIMPKNRRIRDSNIWNHVFLTALIIGIFFSGQPSVSAQDEPQTVIKSAPWNFGYVLQKSEVSHRFYLYNVGSSPLSVLKIKAGCSCTSVSKVEQPIAPGDSAAIVVTFKSGRYHGRVKKTTKVYTDDPEASVHHLPIIANVVKEEEPTDDVSVTPQKLTWKKDDGIIAVDADTLRITNNGTSILAATVLHAPEKIVTEIDHPQSIAPGEAADLILHISKEPMPDESGWLSTTLGFTGPDTTVITIPIEIEE